MKSTIFEYRDYRAYLRDQLPTQGIQRGSRLKLAEAIGVQKGFISAVLNGHADINLEQAFRIGQHLSLSSKEKDYFLLLVQMARAGSKELQAHFETKLQALMLKRREIKESIMVKKSLSEQDQLIYYSSWHYMAIHMCLMVTPLQTPTYLARYLGMSMEHTTQVLEYLVRATLARQEGGRFSATPTRMHLSSKSPLISKNHTNWRLQALQSLDRVSLSDLHYSLVASLSKEAAEQIRQILLQAIQSTEPIISQAKDEEVYALTLDLFALRTNPLN